MNTTSPMPVLHVLNVARAALIALVSLSPLLWSHAAQAQTVHKCVVEGHVVYQSSACPNPGPASASVAAAPAPAPAPAPAAPKKKTLAELLRERDGAAPAAPVQREAQSDGANILRSRMGAV